MSDLFGFEPADPARPQGQGMGGHHATAPGTTTWLTPPHVIEALGGADSFDLDPCGFPGWATARRVSCWPTDGLAIEWDGRVWLNPPYTDGEIGRWMKRLGDHGRGTALIFARTETAMFQREVFGRAHGLLFLSGRLTFHKPDGSLASGNAGAPSVLCAYGQADLDRLAASNLEGALTPLRFARFVLVNAVRPAERESWRKLVAQHVGKEPISLSDLYRALARHPRTRTAKHWQAKVRQVLQLGPFQPVDRGLWAAA